MCRRRANEDQARLRATTREVGSLGKEPVARMDCIASAGLGRRDNGVGVQIRRHALAWQFSHLVGGAHMQRARVVPLMNGDGAKTQIGGRPGDANAISPRLAIRSLVMGMVRSAA